MIFRFHCTQKTIWKSVFFTVHTPLTYAISVGVRTVKKNWRSFGKVDKMRRRQNQLNLLENRSFLVSWVISNSLKCRSDCSSNQQSMRTQRPFVPNLLLDLLNIHWAFPWQNSFSNGNFAFQADWWRSSTLQLCSAFTENFDSPSSISHSIPDHYYVFC